MVTCKPSAFSSKDYALRRRELVTLLKDDSIAILPGAVSQIRNSDVHYRFRQNSDFLYLTGFEESDAVLALVPGREHGQTILFCQERDDTHERWHGDITGPEAAIECLGFDDAFPIADIDDILPGLIEGRSSLYYPMGHDVGFDNQIIDWVNMISANGQKYRTPSVEFIQLDQFLHELRLHKSDAELKLMRQAARATCQGHLRILRFTRPGMMEYEIEAELYHEFAMHGAREPAYPAIVGGGSNACVLHYIANNDELRDGDLVLVDAGGEFENYACDLTRTFPVNGRFSPAQSQIYDLVINAQLAAIDAVKPGNTWNEPHEAAVREITAGLLGLGILKGDLEELIETAAYLRYYPHKTGHWLGLDVHDVGDYQVNGMWRVFEEGMVTAIEPGIYFDPSDKDLPEHYRGIGIRIEDDVLVTRTGNEVLTGEVPKTIKDIESFMAGRRS